MSYVLASLNPLRVIQTIIFGALVVATLFTLKTSPIVAVLSGAAFGLLLSGILPTLMGLMMDRHFDRSGLGSGILVLAGGFGSLLAPGLIGFYC